MTARVLVVDVVAVHRDLVADLPVSHRRAGTQNDARGVGTHDVVVEPVAPTPERLLGEPVEEPERGQGLEDARPHRIEVDRRRHHREEHLVRCELGQRDLVDVQTSPRILVLARHAVEHVLLVTAHEHRTRRGGHRDLGEDLARGAGAHGVKNLTHLGEVSWRRAHHVRRRR